MRANAEALTRSAFCDELMWHPEARELFKPKIALQNLHDSPTRYAEGFGQHVCACEREFVEKGAQAF
jgi:hypothetical protein